MDATPPSIVPKKSRRAVDARGECGAAHIARNPSASRSGAKLSDSHTSPLRPRRSSEKTSMAAGGPGTNRPKADFELGRTRTDLWLPWLAANGNGAVTCNSCHAGSLTSLAGAAWSLPITMIMTHQQLSGSDFKLWEVASARMSPTCGPGHNVILRSHETEHARKSPARGSHLSRAAAMEATEG